MIVKIVVVQIYNPVKLLYSSLYLNETWLIIPFWCYCQEFAVPSQEKPKLGFIGQFKLR